MKKTSCIFVLLAYAFLVSCQASKSGPTPKTSTTFPQEAWRDYQPRDYHAKVAFPDSESGAARIWLKGSIQSPYCVVSGELHALEPPFYTRMLEVKPGRMEVRFLDSAHKPAGSLVLYPRSSDFFVRDSFSILTYGCFQPFDVDETSGEAMVRRDTALAEFQIREAFRKIALGAVGRYYRVSDSIMQQQPLLNTSVAALGTGDQIYTDPAYYIAPERNSMTAWSRGDKPQPLLSEKAFQQHLDRSYRSFISFRVFDDVFRKIPSTAVWDDHEIRDGWGSQGDEYFADQGGFENLNPKLKSYFLSAREAYASHMVLNGTFSEEVGQHQHDLHQEVKIGPADCFLLDLRSHRNIQQKQVMAPEQLEAFADWLHNRDSGQTAIIVSSVPLFWQAPELLEEGIVAGSDKMEDDVMDAWASDANIEQRNEIYSLLIKARTQRNLKIIVLSGDLHVGAINQVRYKAEGHENRVLAYEMIVSGLAHKALHKQAWGRQLANFVSSNGELADELSLGTNTSDGNTYSLSSSMKVSAAKLNFGAIDFEGNQPVLNIFFQDDYQMLQLRMPTQWRMATSTEPVEIREIEGKAKASTFLAAGDELEQRVIVDIPEPER